jgi:hypothetical protein
VEVDGFFASGTNGKITLKMKVNRGRRRGGVDGRAKIKSNHLKLINVSAQLWHGFEIAGWNDLKLNRLTRFRQR